MAAVSVPLANYDGGLKERPKPQRSGTFTIAVNHHWVLNVGGRKSKGPINGALDRWTIEPTATGLQSCRVTITSNSDPTVHFAFDLPNTSAETLSSELETHADYLRIAEQHQAEIHQLSDNDISLHSAGEQEARAVLQRPRRSLGCMAGRDPPQERS